jgi:hypothetical protein
MATTTPNYGWDVPTSSDYVKDGAVAIETLGDDIDASLYTALGGNYPGLRLIKKQTIGTAVTSVTVTNAFSATYENYKIIVSGGASTSGVNVAMTLGASATQYYATLGNISYATAIFGAFALNNGAAWPYVGYVDANGWRIGLDLYSPFLAKSTTFNGYYTALASSSGAVLGIHNEQTSYTDFTISIAAATATGGTIYVYGYRKS